MAEIAELQDGTFAAEVFHAEEPTLVAFWAPWCKPCRHMEPVLAELAHECRGALRVVRLNIDDSPMAAAMYGVRSVPTVILFRQEDELAKVAGFVGKDELLERIRVALRGDCDTAGGAPPSLDDWGDLPPATH